jgi:hypothetical protein
MCSFGGEVTYPARDISGGMRITCDIARNTKRPCPALSPAPKVETAFWAAREMIIIPILEQIEEGQPIYWDQVDESINKLVETTREESRPAERSRFGGVNSLSIIRSYFRNFCNIPPFCLPTDEVRTRSP